MNSNAFDWLSSHADRTPDRTALVNTASGAERTYETVNRLGLKPRGTRLAHL